MCWVILLITLIGEFLSMDHVADKAGGQFNELGFDKTFPDGS